MLSSRIIAVLLTVLTTARVQAANDDSPPPPPSSARIFVPEGQLLHWQDRNKAPVGSVVGVPDWTHPSWTDQHAAEWRTQATVPAWTRHVPAAQSGHREAFQTLEGRPLTWEPIKADASSSTGPSETRHHIPMFMQPETGQRWGPYPLGEEKFVMQSYPLDIPLFQHFYQDDLNPADFEQFISKKRPRPNYEDTGSSAVEPAGARWIDSAGIRYRPEPAVLRAVQETSWKHLRQHGIQPRKVTLSDVMEGEYLWPPVHVPDDEGENLIFPPKVLAERYRHSITQRLREAKGAPSMFHLETEANGQVRHILMRSGKGGNHVLHRYWTPRDDSRLWLLYEGMVAPAHVQGHPQRFAFLGATFLPKKAEKHLQNAGVLKLAFPGVTQVPH